MPRCVFRAVRGVEPRSPPREGRWHQPIFTAVLGASALRVSTRSALPCRSCYQPVFPGRQRGLSPQTCADIARCSALRLSGVSGPVAGPARMVSTFKGVVHHQTQCLVSLDGFEPPTTPPSRALYPLRYRLPRLLMAGASVDVRLSSRPSPERQCPQRSGQRLTFLRVPGRNSTPAYRHGARAADRAPGSGSAVALPVPGCCIEILLGSTRRHGCTARASTDLRGESRTRTCTDAA